jgi:hypothetical protein
MEPDQAKPKTFLERFQTLDRRILYAVFFVFVVAAHFVPIQWPSTPAKHTRALYEAIEEAPLDKVVAVDSDWFAGIRAESENQMRAVFRHLMRRRLKFVMLAWARNPEGQKFGYDIAADVAKEYGYEYGKDWVALGMVAKARGAELASLAKDIHGFVETDMYGTSLDDAEALPIMQEVENIYDIGFIMSFSYGFDPNWLGFIQGVYGTPFGVAMSAIESSTAYSFFESGQVCGIIAGAPGAAEYEELLDLPESKRPARTPVNVLSISIVYVLIAILLGNVAYLTSLRKTR